jgi:hypothetical protein
LTAGHLSPRKIGMLNFPHLEPASACISLARRGVTALITDGWASASAADEFAERGTGYEQVQNSKKQATLACSALR